MTAGKLEKLETLKKEYAEKKSIDEAYDRWLEYYKAVFKAGKATEEETERERSTLAAQEELRIKLPYLETEIKSIERQHAIELNNECNAKIREVMNILFDVNYELEPPIKNSDWWDKFNKARELFFDGQEEALCIY